MKQLITEKDIKLLTGKWVVQLNAEQNESCMAIKFAKNPGFWLEKRIFFVGVLYGSDGYPALKREHGPQNSEQWVILNGLYYTHGIYPIKEFIPYWNHYQFGKDPIKWEEYKDKRYHRLLTNKELDWLTEELKK